MESRRTKLGKTLLAFTLAMTLAVPLEALAEAGPPSTATQEKDAGAEASQILTPATEGDPGPSISVEPVDPDAPDDAPDGAAGQDPVDTVVPEAPEAPNDSVVDPAPDSTTAKEPAASPDNEGIALLAENDASNLDPATHTGTLYFGPRENVEGGEWSLFVDSACKIPYTGQAGTWEVSGKTLKLNGFHYTAERCDIGLYVTFAAKGACIELSTGSTNSIALGQGVPLETDGAALRAENDLSIVGAGSLSVSAGTSGGADAGSQARDCVGIYARSLAVTQANVRAQGGRAGSRSKTGVDVLDAIVLDGATLHAEDGSGGYGVSCYTLEMRSDYTAPAELDARGSQGVRIARQPQVAGNASILGNASRDGVADQSVKYLGGLYLIADTGSLAKHVNVVSSAIANHSLYLGRVNGKMGLYCDRNLTVPYNPPKKNWSFDGDELELNNFEFVTTAPVALECLEDCTITIKWDTVNRLASFAEGVSYTAGIHSDHRVTIGYGMENHPPELEVRGGNSLPTGTTVGIEANEVVIPSQGSQTIAARGGYGGTSFGIKARKATLGYRVVAEGGTAGLSVSDTFQDQGVTAVLGREDLAGDELIVAQHDRSSTYFQVNGKPARHIETSSKSGSRLYFGPHKKDADNNWDLFTNREHTYYYRDNKENWSVSKRADGTPELKLKGFSYVSSDEVALEVWNGGASPSGKVAIVLADNTGNLLAVDSSGPATALDAGEKSQLIIEGSGNLEASSRTSRAHAASTGIRAKALDITDDALVIAQAWNTSGSTSDDCIGVKTMEGGAISGGTLHAAGDSMSVWAGKAFGPPSFVKAQGRADRTSGDLTEARYNENSYTYEGAGGKNQETYLSSVPSEVPLYFAPKDRAHPEGDWTLYTDAEYTSEYPSSQRWRARGNTLHLSGFTYLASGATALNVYNAPAAIAFEGQNAFVANGPSDKEDAAAIRATAPLVITGSEGATFKATGTAGKLTKRGSAGIAAGELTLRDANVEALGARYIGHGTGYGIRATGLTVSHSTVDARGGTDQSQAIFGYGLHVSKTEEGKSGLLKVEGSKIYAQGRSGAVYAEVTPDIPYQQTIGSKELGGGDFVHAIFSDSYKRYLAQDALALQMRIGDTASETLYFGPLNRNPNDQWSLFTDAECTQAYQGKNWKAHGKTLELTYFSYFTTANTALYLYDGASLSGYDSVVASVGESPGQKRGIKAESDFTYSSNAALTVIAAPSSGQGDSIGIEAHNIVQTDTGYLRAEARKAAGGSSYGIRVGKYVLTDGAHFEALGYTAGVFSNEESEFRNRTVKGRIHRDSEEALKKASYSASSKCYEVDGSPAQFVSATEQASGPLYFGSVNGVWSLYTDSGRTRPYTGSGWSVDGNALVLSDFEYTSEQTAALVIQGNATIRLEEGTSTIECRNAASRFPTHAIEAPDGLTIEGDDRAVLEVKAEALPPDADAEDDRGYLAEDSYNAAVNVAGIGNGKNLVLKGGMLKVTAKGGNDRQLMHGVVCSGKTTFAGGSVSVSIEGGFAGNGLRTKELSYEKGSFEGMTSSGWGAFWVDTETTPFRKNVDILGGDTRSSNLVAPRWDRYTHSLVIDGNPCPYVRITPDDTPLYFGPRDGSQFAKWSLFTDPHYTIEYAGQRDAWKVFGTMLVLENFNLTTSHGTALEVENNSDAAVAATADSTNTLKSTANDGEESSGIHAWGPLEITGSGTLNVTGGSPGLWGKSYGVKAEQLKVNDTVLIASGRTAGVSASSEPAHNTLVWGSTSKSGGQLKEAVWQGDRYRVDGATARYVRFSQFDPRGALYFGPENNVPGNPWSLFANPSRTVKYAGEGAMWSVEGKNLKLNNFTYQTEGFVGLSVSADPDATITLQPGTRNTIRADAWMDVSTDTVAALRSDGPLAIVGQGELTVTAGGSWTRGNRYGIDALSLTVTAKDVNVVGDTAAVHTNVEPAHPGLTVKGSTDRYGLDLKDVTWSEGRYLVGKMQARFVEFENDLAAAGLYFGGAGAEWSLYTDAYKTHEYPGKGVTWSAAGHTLTLKGLQFETWSETALTVDSALDAAIVLAPDSVSSFKSTAKGASSSYGVYAWGNLTIGGPGSLIVSGGDSAEAGSSTGLHVVASLTVNGGKLLLEGGTGDISTGLSALLGGAIKGGIVDARGDTGGARTFHESGLTLANGVVAEGAVNRDDETLKPAAFDAPSSFYQVDGQNARHMRFSAPPNPVIAVDPGLLAFGLQPVGTKSAVQRVRVSATELTADLSIEAPEGFTVAPADGWDPRVGGELLVTFDPTEAKSYGGTLWLRSQGAPDAPVVLTGEGHASVIAADPELVAFGYQAVATKSAEQRVRVQATNLKGDLEIEEPQGFTVTPAEGWDPRAGGSLRVTFDPLEAKSYGGILWLRAKGLTKDVSAQVALTGEGRISTVRASTGRLSFGRQPVATKSAEQRVRITADGLESDLGYEVPEGFTVVPAEGWNARTGGELRVTFDPLQAKPYAAMLMVGADGADAASVALTGTGCEVAVAADPGFLAFGMQGVGSVSETKTVTVSAAGLTANMSFEAPEGFKVVPGDDWDPRSGGQLRVTFAPAEAKSYAGVLWIGADGADAAPVALTGEGVKASIKVTPQHLPFGNQTVNTKSSERRVKVEAVGLSTDMAFAEVPGFEVTPADSWDPRSGGELRVAFKPTEEKSYQGALAISSARVKATPITLGGTGTKPTVIILPTYNNFGSQPVGTESAEKRIHVSAFDAQADLEIIVPAGFKAAKAPGWNDRTGGDLLVRFAPTEAKLYFESLGVACQGVWGTTLLDGEGRRSSIKLTPEKLDFGAQAVGTASEARVVEVAASDLAADIAFDVPDGFSVEPAPGWNARTGGKLRVTFAPKQAVPYSALLAVKAGSAAAHASLTGEGKAASITASPGKLGFGPQPVATKSAERLVNVKAVALREDMQLTVPDGFTVAPAENWNARTGGTLRVTFDPTEAKPYRGTLRLESTDVVSTVALSGEGRAVTIQATPDHLAFEPQAVGTKSSEQDIVVTASGLTGDMTVDEPAGFTVAPANGWNPRTGGILRVTFDPIEARHYADHVRISADGADGVSVAVSGEGRVSTIVATPERLAFGSQAVGTKSAEKLVTVKADNLTDDLALSAPAGFTVTPAGGWNPRTGGTLRVTFDPTDEKHYAELLQISADGADAATVTLDGTGTRSTIEVDPQMVAFGAQQVGTKSAECVVEVRSANLTHDMTFSAPGGFTVTPDAAFDARTGGKLHITFDPVEEKSYGAVMWIEADGADGAPLTLTGEGVVPDIAVNPKLLSFGNQPVGTKSAEKLVEVKAHDLAGDMSIAQVDGFTVTPAEGWSPRTGGTLRVTFDPTEAKDYGQTLRIEADGADGASVSLTGTGHAVAIEVNPGLVAFGKQPVGKQSAYLTVDVAASGLTQDMRFTEIPAGFTTKTGPNWDPRTGGKLLIQFAPTDVKTYNGVMWIESDGADRVPIVLTGEGRLNVIATDRDLLSFGYVEVGQRSSAMTVNVQANLPATSNLSFTPPDGFEVTKSSGWNDQRGGELQISFKPGQARVYGEIMWIGADGADSIPLTLTGQGYQSTVTATPGRLSFGSQLVGTKSAEQLVKITASDAPGSLTYTVPDGFTVTPHEDWDPNAGGFLRVTFDPTQEKEYADFLRIQRGGEEACVVALGGTGCVARIDVAPAELDFGNQAVGSRSFEKLIEVRATNVGSDLDYDDLAGSGFAVDATADWNPRTGGHLRVTFEPTQEKVYGSQLQISASGADAVTVPLRGKGVVESVDVSPGLVAFGFQPIGVRSAEQLVEVRGVNLSHDLSYTDLAGSDFVVVPADGWDARTGGTLRVSFEPTRQESYGETLWIGADGVDAAPVLLTGEGRMANIEVVPERLAFGKQAVATKSAEQLVKVSATGLSSDLVVDVPEGFTATPAAGWNARTGGTLRVTFDPIEERLYGGVMTVSADGANARSVTLTGRGGAASIGASPGLVAFGYQPVATKSAEQLVHVEAHGLAGDMAYVVPQGFTVTPADNWNARAGGDLRVTFDPTEAKSYGGVMWIEASGADSTPVTLTGEGRDAVVKAVPGRLSFGNQAVGTKSAEQRVKVDASGLSGDLAFTAPDGFTVTPAEGWNARTGGILRVTFDPVEARVYNAAMRIEADGADGAAVSLAGVGCTSAIEVSPSLVAFGFQPLATKSAEQLVEVRASGLEHDMAFTAPAGFTVVPGEGWDPLVGGTLRITFDPTEEKPYGEDMWIEADGADAAPITLTGEGRATAIKASPNLLAFDMQPVGTKSAEQRVRVAASGLTEDLSFQAPEGFTVMPAEGWDARTGGELRVTFDPTEAKVYGDTMLIESDGADAVSVTLTGEGRDAAVKATPGRLLFDDQVVGTKSVEQRVRVVASGLTGDMVLDVPEGFTVMPAEGWDARTGGELRVTFDPTEAKAYSGALRIRFNGFDGAAVALIGKGVVSKIAASPGLVAFGYQPVGTKSKEERVRVVAAGLTDDIAFDAPEGFTVAPAEGWNPRTGGELRITFNPAEAKDYGAVMWIGADGADAAPVTLTGEGRLSAVKATPPAFAFGDQPVGTKSAEKRVTVAASGLTGDMVLDVPDGFTATPAAGWDPRAGGILRVTFDPTEAKEYGAVLSIAADGVDPARVVLTGEGREQAIAADQGLLAFGFQPVATKSAEQRVRVVASGLTSDMDFVEPDGFTVVPAEGWDPRAGGTLRVTFDPLEARVYGAVVWIESDGADPAPVTLTGEGSELVVKANKGLLTFGSQPVATKSLEQRVSVAASGLTSDLVVDAPDGFTVVPAEGWDPRAGGTLRVTFDPLEARAYGGIMWIGADGADAAPVALTGEGRELKIAATPKNLEFGRQEAGTASTAQTVEVAASGLEREMALQVPDGFTVTPDEGWSAYTGGRLRVTFNPAEAKAYGGVLWIESDGADAQAVALTGEGVKPAPPVPPKPEPPKPITGDGALTGMLWAVALLAVAVAGASWLRLRRRRPW